jgi:hypothetical protein
MDLMVLSDTTVGISIGPFERLGAFVVGFDRARDFAGEVACGSEDATGDQIALNFGEPDFDLIEPGRVSRGEMEVNVRMKGEELSDRPGLVCRKVVGDNVDFLFRGLRGDHVGQEGDQLSAGVAVGCLSQDLPGSRIQSRIERKSAVAKVFEPVALGTAGRKRQDRVKPVQGLDGALFIDGENRRVHWRVEVETNDIGRLGLKIGIVAGQVPPETMGLKTSLAPDLRDVRLGRSQLSGQSAGTPVGGSSARFAVQSPVDNPCFELLAARGGLTAAMPAVESSQSILAETLPPQAHGVDAAALATADRPQRKPTTEIENDASPAAIFAASAPAVGHLHKFPAFRRTNNKRCCHAFQHSLAVSALKNSLH